MKIKEFIDNYNVTLPIVRIQDDVYLIGANRATLKLEQNQLYVRSGLQFEPLKEYI
jgi:hypothetical protein